MYQIPKPVSDAYFNIVVGPLLSETDAVTPVLGYTDFGNLPSVVSIINSDGNTIDVSLAPYMNGFTECVGASGYYELSIKNDSGLVFPNAGNAKILIQDPGVILPYNLDIMVVHPNYWDMMYNGPLYNTKVNWIWAQISGASTDDIKADTEDILASMSQVGSISADLVSGGAGYKTGTTIKDIEVRDNEVFVSFRDTDGKLKTFSQVFSQDVVIASGGSL